MTTPGSMRTKFWRDTNKKRYAEYMKEYMKKRRADARNGQVGHEEDGVLGAEVVGKGKVAGGDFAASKVPGRED
jgi:hypothetical protein